MSHQWKYKVVKTMLGMHGARFDFPTACTFETFADASMYARDFADAQRKDGVRAEVEVRARGGKHNRGTTVEIWRVFGLVREAVTRWTHPDLRDERWTPTPFVVSAEERES